MQLQLLGRTLAYSLPHLRARPCICVRNAASFAQFSSLAALLAYCVCGVAEHPRFQSNGWHPRLIGEVAVADAKAYFFLVCCCELLASLTEGVSRG